MKPKEQISICDLKRIMNNKLKGVINISKIGKWTEEVDKTKHIIKDREFITENGEIIQLHDSILENIAMDIANHKEAEEQKKRDIKQKFIEKEGFEKDLVNQLGNFYFSFYTKLPKIDKQYLFRFIYLSTYLKYNDTKLAYKEDNGRYKLIKEYELQELLKLKKAEYFNTKKALIENNLIHIDKDNNICINKKIHVLGDIVKTKQEYTRIFKDSIRELYNKSTSREHKKLYIFYELLPYINYNLNIICTNVKEVDPELIEPLDLNFIIDNLYINKQRSVAKKQLLNITLGGEYLLIMISKYNKNFFAVNPKLYYKGNRKEDLNYLLDLFRV